MVVYLVIPTQPKDLKKNQLMNVFLVDYLNQLRVLSNNKFIALCLNGIVGF